MIHLCRVWYDGRMGTRSFSMVTRKGGWIIDGSIRDRVHGETPSRGSWWYRRSRHQSLTHLVVDLARGILEVDRLGEDIARLFELDALGPVVEGTGHVDFVGGMLPTRKLGVSPDVSDIVLVPECDMEQQW
jgi:hypothetical protein